MPFVEVHTTRPAIRTTSIGYFQHSSRLVLCKNLLYGDIRRPVHFQASVFCFLETEF